MRSIYGRYRDGLRGVEGISVIPFRIDEGELPQWTDVLVDKRDDLYDYLAAHGIRGRKFWHPLHTQPPYRMPSQQFPNSSKQIPHAMWLPSAFTLSDEDVAAVYAEVQSFVKLHAGLNGGRSRQRAVT
jgi:dTDP-4-amino-4,6-dideoxygalactose transaminase